MPLTPSIRHAIGLTGEQRFYWLYGFDLTGRELTWRSGKVGPPPGIRRTALCSEPYDQAYSGRSSRGAGLNSGSATIVQLLAALFVIRTIQAGRLAISLSPQV